MQKNSAKRPVYKYRVNIGVEIDYYQWKVLMLNIFQLLLILVTMKNIYKFHSYISDDNEQDACD